MIRIILGVFAGYLGMAIVVMTTLVAAAFAVGTSRLIDAETGEISTWFIIVAEWPISIVSAIIGGVIASLVAGRAGRKQAVKALAAAIIMIGFVSAAFQLFEVQVGDEGAGAAEAALEGPAANTAELLAAAEDDGASSDDVRLEELPDKPMWDAIALPLIGALGIMIGGGIIEPRRKES
jgi:hypothetical protein